MYVQLGVGRVVLQTKKIEANNVAMRCGADAAMTRPRPKACSLSSELPHLMSELISKGKKKKRKLPIVLCKKNVKIRRKKVSNDELINQKINKRKAKKVNR